MNVFVVLDSSENKCLNLSDRQTFAAIQTDKCLDVRRITPTLVIVGPNLNYIEIHLLSVILACAGCRRFLTFFSSPVLVPMKATV